MTTSNSSADAVTKFLIGQALKQPGIVRVILFGSRARGDDHARSDWDVAIDGPTLSASDWSKWAEFAREHVPTLCGLDLIHLQQTSSPQLLSAVQREGKILFERKTP